MNLKTLVEKKLIDKNEKMKDLVQRMGYKNITKGLRRLDDCLSRGECSEEFLKNLATVLDVDLLNISLALSETLKTIEEVQEAKRRKNFRPHIWILHSLKVPNNITVVALLGIGRLKIIPVDQSIIEKSLWEQIEYVREITQRHYFEKEGKCTSFGKITGYLYFYKFDEWVELGTDGTVKEYHQGQFHQPVATLQVANKAIHKGLF